MDSPIYDVFISHAIEDKIPCANELCSLLEKYGYTVYYEGNELLYGADFPGALRKGFQHARQGIILLSSTYLSKINEQNFVIPDKDIATIVPDLSLSEVKALPISAGSFIFCKDESLKKIADRLRQNFLLQRKVMPPSPEKERHSGIMKWLMIDL